MAVDPKRTAPVPVAVTEDGTDAVVHPGDAANKAIRVNLVVGAGPSGGPSSAFNAPFPASGFGAGAKATALAPTYVEGDMVPLSVGLDGTLRSTAGAGGGGTDVAIHDSTTPTQHLAINASGQAAIQNEPNNDVALSTRATEATLALIKAKTDNLDVALSTRTKPADTQKVDGSAVTQPVSGTFWQATQPVSGTVTANQGGTWTVQPGNTANTTAWKVDGSAVTQPVSGTFWQATQPVSGTVTANIGTSGSLALDATLTGGTARTKVTDGTTNAAVKAASTAAVAADPALVVAVSPNNTIPVSGTFWQATQPVSGTVTSNQGTANATPWNDNVAQWGGTATTLGQKVMASSVPVTLASDQSTIATKAFQAVTYTAIYRLATRPYALSNAFGAAGRKQYATIFHAATAVKLVKVKRVEVALESSSVAAIVMADLVRLTNATTPATGNPAVTPTPQNPGDAASEATCLSLPTTAGTEGAVHSFLEWNLGITGAASVANPPPALNWYTLWPQVQGAGEVPENKYPTMRAAIAEGFAVTVDSNAIGTVKGYVVMEFSEE